MKKEFINKASQLAKPRPAHYLQNAIAAIVAASTTHRSCYRFVAIRKSLPLAWRKLFPLLHSEFLPGNLSLFAKTKTNNAT